MQNVDINALFFFLYKSAFRKYLAVDYKISIDCTTPSDSEGKNLNSINHYWKNI